MTEQIIYFAITYGYVANAIALVFSVYVAIAYKEYFKEVMKYDKHEDKRKSTMWLKLAVPYWACIQAIKMNYLLGKLTPEEYANYLNRKVK